MPGCFVVFLLLHLPFIFSLTCYTGINAEYKEWAKHIHGLVSETNNPAFLNVVVSHTRLPLSMRSEKCSGTDLCLMASKLLHVRTVIGGYVSRCETRRNCHYFRETLRKSKMAEEVVCCEQDFCNLPYPASIETEQPPPSLTAISTSKNHRQKISSKLRTVVSCALPVAVVALFG